MRLSKDLLDVWYADPVAWAYDVLRERPKAWQEEMLHEYAKHDWIAIAATRRAGKSRFEAMVGLHWLTTRFESLTFTAAPTWRQVTGAVWTEINHLWSESKLPSIFPSWAVLTANIKTPYPRWRGHGVASNDVQNLEGFHAGRGGALVIHDEAKGTPDDFFESTLNMIGASDVPGKLVVAGTPGIPRGFFYRAFATDRHLWGAVRRISALDIPELRARAEAARDRLGEDSPYYRQQQLAQFAMAEGNVVIPLNYVEAAVDREIREEKSWKRVASLDPAGTGEDESVLTLTHGPIVERQIPWQGWDEIRTAKHAWDEALRHGADYIVVDEPGIGLSIVALLETYAKLHNDRTGDGVKVLRYKPGKKARDRERFQNRKSEDLFALADRFRDGDISIPDDPVLIGQLVSYTWRSTTGSKTEVVDPSDSPDRADSLQMAYAIDSLAHHVRGINPPEIP